MIPASKKGQKQSVACFCNWNNVKDIQFGGRKSQGKKNVIFVPNKKRSRNNFQQCFLFSQFIHLINLNVKEKKVIWKLCDMEHWISEWKCFSWHSPKRTELHSELSFPLSLIKLLRWTRCFTHFPALGGWLLLLNSDITPQVLLSRCECEISQLRSNIVYRDSTDFFQQIIFSGFI